MDFINNKNYKFKGYGSNIRIYTFIEKEDEKYKFFFDFELDGNPQRGTVEFHETIIKDYFIGEV